MNKKIVNIRAFAILIIVLGHSIILYSKSWGIYTTIIEVPLLNVLKDIINSFQLELFFALSGFLFYKSVEKGGGTCSFVRKKALRLMIPYYIIAFFWMDPIKLLLSTPGFNDVEAIKKSLGWQFLFSGSSTGHLWFLPTLFLIFVFSFIFLKKIKKLNVCGFSAFVLILVFAYYIGPRIPGYFQLNNVLHYAVFFFIGYFLYYISIRIEIFRFRKGIVLCTIILSLLRVFTIYVHLLYILCLILCIYILIPNKTTKWTQLISENSFGIYLIHSPLVYITYTYFKDCNPIFVLCLNFFVFGGISLLLSIMIRKSRLKFILGE